MAKPGAAFSASTNASRRIVVLEAVEQQHALEERALGGAGLRGWEVDAAQRFLSAGDRPGGEDGDKEQGDGGERAAGHGLGTSLTAV